MPTTSKPSVYTEDDPAHPDQPNQDHTTASGEKPKDVLTVMADTDFMPTLEDAPASQHAKSHLLLLLGLCGAVFATWLMGFELFQVKESWTKLGIGGVGVVAAGLVVLWFTGSLWIDWWELVVGYWWLSFPIAGGAATVLLLMQENAASWEETD